MLSLNYEINCSYSLVTLNKLKENPWCSRPPDLHESFCMYFRENPYTLTQLRSISLRLWTPHICMVSASSFLSFSVRATAPSAPPP